MNQIDHGGGRRQGQPAPDMDRPGHKARADGKVVRAETGDPDADWVGSGYPPVLIGRVETFDRHGVPSIGRR